MSPRQYKALERLVDADFIGMNLGDHASKGIIQRDTAAALARRGLCIILYDNPSTRRLGGPGVEYAKATTAGVALLATNKATP